MKKLLFAVFLIILSQISYAYITINVPESDIFNLGDKIEIDGYIESDKNFDGNLLLFLQCDDKMLPIYYKHINIKQNKRIFLDEILDEIPASKNMVGECKFKIELGNETAQSNKFFISKNLTGEFYISGPIVQLGNDLIVRGEVKKINGEMLENGVAEIYLVKNENKYFVGTSEINNGKFEFIYNTAMDQPGEQKFSVYVMDAYGNEQFFEEVANVELTDELYVFFVLEKTKFYPGDYLKVNGEVKNILFNEVEEGDVEIELGEKIYTTKIKNGKFEEKILLWNLKSGIYNLTIVAKDKFSNKGLKSAKIEILQVLKSIKIFVPENITPGNILPIKFLALDQTNQTMDDKEINIEVFNTEGEKIFEKVLYSDEEFEYKVQNFSTPGRWKIIAKCEGVVSEKTFFVNKKKDVSVKILNGSKIVVKNIGNVKFTDGIKVDINGDANYTIIRTTPIDVNETLIIDLSKELPAGKYNITIFSGIPIPKLQGNYANVENGKPRKSFSEIYSLLAMTSILILLFLAGFVEVKKTTENKNRFSKVKKGKSIKEKFIEAARKIEEQEKEKKGYVGKALDEKEIKDFVNRVLKEIKKVEAKKNGSNELIDQFAK